VTVAGMGFQAVATLWLLQLAVRPRPDRGWKELFRAEDVYKNLQPATLLPSVSSLTFIKTPVVPESLEAHAV